MTPFQEFRFWARRAPAGERVVTGIGITVAVGLLAWLVAPSGSHRSTDVSAVAAGRGGATSATSVAPGGLGAPAAAAGQGPLSAAGPVGAGGTGPASAGGAAGPASASTPAAGAVGAAGGASSGVVPGGNSAAPGSPACPAASNVRGVSATQIKVAVVETNIIGPAANSLFGVPAPAQQQADFAAVIASVNAAGGVACRKLVAQYFAVNPADQNDEQQKCLDIDQAGVFAVLDTGGYANTNPVCFPQHHIPYFGGYLFTAKEGRAGYPYLFDFNTNDHLYHDTVFALKDRGFFGSANGFKKLGFVYRSCYPEVITAELGWLHQAGLSNGQIVTYDVGCPSVFASPSDLSQAVLKFQQNGVTHVTDAFFLGDMPNFTATAQQQGFHPKYGLADDALISIAYGNQPPDANNMSNAIAITASRDAEERTPGMSPTAGTMKCDQIYKSHGLAGVHEQPALAGNACDQTWMFVQAVDHAPTLAPAQLAAGLQRAKSVDFSYPQGPNDFSGAGVTTGGEFWRVAQFYTSCKCWRLVDQTFHPSYPFP